MGKRGPQPKPKAEQGVTFTTYASPDCVAILARLIATGKHGKTKGAVICAALKLLDAQPDAP